MGVAKGRSIQGARWRTRQAAKTINRQDILPNIQEGWMAKSKAGQAMFGGEKESENGKTRTVTVEGWRRHKAPLWLLSYKCSLA